ncbi:sialate O-acetylesterase [Geofilum sp. OHC36d9]|uniref:sialate O-acetylesterase n=1 Tax=Geofilum sp. OHC36d9 TaxID=3458413 RepID=UPI004034F3E9
MKSKSFIFLLGLILTSCSTPHRDLDIYLCIGQSNMAGRATIDETVEDTLEHVFLFTNDTTEMWVKAANPLNKYSTIRKSLKIQKVGPSFSFGEVMAKMQPDKEIGLVVNAKGGTSINQWHPDSLFFKEAVRRTKLAMKYGHLKGIIWHQGCADARKWNSYLPKLQYMVAQLRKELGDADLPIVVGQLSYDKPFRKSFNEMLLAVPDSISHSAVVSSEGLTTIDKTHFDTKSQVVFGQRYAEKMIGLISARSDKPVAD